METMTTDDVAMAALRGWLIRWNGLPSEFDGHWSSNRVHQSLSRYAALCQQLPTIGHESRYFTELLWLCGAPKEQCQAIRKSLYGKNPPIIDMSVRFDLLDELAIVLMSFAEAEHGQRLLVRHMPLDYMARVMLFMEFQRYLYDRGHDVLHLQLHPRVAADAPLMLAELAASGNPAVDVQDRLSPANWLIWQAITNLFCH